MILTKSRIYGDGMALPEIKVRKISLGIHRRSVRVNGSVKGKNLTRLEEEAEKLVAIDVEYSVVVYENDGAQKRLQLPAEVCVINSNYETILRTACDSRLDLMPSNFQDETDWTFKGGVPPKLWIGASRLNHVREKILACIVDRPVVGHNLAKDLTCLGIADRIPVNLRRDTMRYSSLQDSRGFGKSLSHLTRTKLGREIQVCGQRHDPYEDAVAALELYVKYVHFDKERMSYNDLVEMYTQNILHERDG